MSVSIDIDKVFLHQTKRKVYKDSTITLNGVLYEVSSILIGKSINIKYDPSTVIKKLEVSYDGKNYGEIKPVDAYANTKMVRNYNSKKYETSNNNAKENILNNSLNATIQGGKK